MKNHEDSPGRDSHARWREQLPGYLLGALDPAEQADLEEHLRGCGECTAELRWLRPAAEALPTDVEPTEPPAGLKRTVMDAVESDLEESTGAAIPERTADDGPAADPDRPQPRGRRADRTRPAGGSGWRRRWAGFPRMAFAGAAATLLVGLVIGYAVRGGGESVGPAGPGTTVARAGKAPGTTAVLVRRGSSGTVRVANLKPPPAGKVYQAWIRRGTKIEPTDSLFSPGRDGTATTAIADLQGVNAVMVTAEPAGGSKRPTSEPFIVLSTG